MKVQPIATADANRYLEIRKELILSFEKLATSADSLVAVAVAVAVAEAKEKLRKAYSTMRSYLRLMVLPFVPLKTLIKLLPENERVFF